MAMRSSVQSPAHESSPAPRLSIVIAIGIAIGVATGLLIRVLFGFVLSGMNLDLLTAVSTGTSAALVTVRLLHRRGTQPARYSA